MLIDSNLLIYALNVSSPKSQAARLFLKTYVDEAVVAQQNILEVTRVMTHPVFENKLTTKSVTKSLKQVTKVMRVIRPQEETWYVYQELMKKYESEGNRVFDVYLAATMLSNEIKVIATDNEKHFKMIEEIKVINPFKSV